MQICLLQNSLPRKCHNTYHWSLISTLKRVASILKATPLLQPSPENKSELLCMLILPVTSLNAIISGVRCVRQLWAKAKTPRPSRAGEQENCNLPFTRDPLLTSRGKIILWEGLFSSITSIPNCQDLPSLHPRLSRLKCVSSISHFHRCS